MEMLEDPHERFLYGIRRLRECQGRTPGTSILEPVRDWREGTVFEKPHRTERCLPKRGRRDYRDARMEAAIRAARNDRKG